MAEFDIIAIILEDLLQIAPKYIAEYSTVTDQLLYLVLVPHVLLFLFIFAFAIGIVARIIGPHKGFRNLVGIVAYLVIVIGGWYGSVLIPLFNAWFNIALVLGLFVFLISIIFNPARSAAAIKSAGSMGRFLGIKPGERKKIEKELKVVQAQISTLMSHPVQPGSHAHAVREMQLQQLRMKEQELLGKLR